MLNKYYTYDNIYLYDPAVWTDHFSTVRFLFQKIEQIDHDHFRFEAGCGPFAGKTGDYNAKTLSYFYPEYINGWKEKGLVFHSTEMGGICWTAMVPNDVYDKKVRTPKVLVVLADADFSDPNWSIHVLTHYDSYTELAAKEGFVILYISMDGVNSNDMPFGVMQEFSVIYNILMDSVYVDVSHLTEKGVLLSSVEGFNYTDENGEPSDPDANVFSFYGIPVLDISHRWQNRSSSCMDVNPAWIQHPKFDREKFIHSEQGKVMAEGLRIEYDYDSIDDPAFQEFWDKKGLEVRSHDFDNYQWISCAPKACLEKTDEKLPVVLIFQEVTYQDKHQPVTALGSYLGYTELAAEGELIALFFALESPEDNERFYDIALEAAGIYPIDLSRIYVTGQSHNGYFADLFAHRFADKIAAVAPLGNHTGIPETAWTTSPFPPTDEMVNSWTCHDLPTIVVTTVSESLNGALHCRQDDDRFSSAARAYQRRQMAMNCPVDSVEEILAARTDANPVRAAIGYPVDEAWVEYHSGSPAYIGDLINNDGKKHFRLALLSNQTHFISPQMSVLGWEFMRRFARDLETGEVIELY